MPACAATIRCVCGRLVLVSSDGVAVCSACRAVYAVAIRVLQEAVKGKAGKG